MDVPRRRMFCRDHGEAEACRICTHLHKGFGRGFHEDNEGRMRSAWCDRCDFFRRMPPALGTAWEFLAGGELDVCEHCLMLAKIANERT